MIKKRPQVGVGVIITKDGKILFGKRKNAHGDGSWCCPGGHLDFGEDIIHCARREVFEETGLQIKNLKMGPFTNDIFTLENKHYLTLFVIAEYDSGEVKVKEPNQCERWGWFDWDNLPQPLFLPYQNLAKQKFNPFDW